MRRDYLRYWSLRSYPFFEAPFFLGTPQRELIAQITDFAADPTRRAHLAGERRCGITRLFKHIASTRGLGDSAVEVLNSNARGWRKGGWIEAIVDAMQLPHGSDIATVRGSLFANQRCGVRTIWLIDEVSPQTLREFEDWKLVNDPLTIVTSGSRWTKSSRSMKLLELRPMDLGDTLQYIRHGIRSAAGTREIFSHASIARIHEHVNGRIADAAVIAERALHRSMQMKLNSVSAEVVEMIAEGYRNSQRNAKAA